ncbi:hypothetical protein YPPY66_4563 [Yersinia pestis PY-66]|uniref:Uncharacterized protein n=2 Tax=Yersinia pestis TaxID=632 RepID=A0AAV3AY57_YERPE|nr:hypothetical protein YpAngola_A3908 [Yersinia pestis Angola]EDR30902.1 hypothetical protein YPIP275_3890 [Yersinia pestis biovar Orientalis str. IP275]EDR37402.1 hypothetical protein YpF1991016_2860 [Yersinia pestis biovar Orientalis str. F1991016]EDR41163.1 hypothetical protein YpE1979001_3939 [Yersinia pestis biovar Antiqua str. E1979001]EDR49846.1 hypothetical protein YpB42003004_2899 [Yersinia pestis biovar Antiqua str. B42003004]EDR57403.1 hypothetical protein YpMG051020_4014 [Yersinia
MVFSVFNPPDIPFIFIAHLTDIECNSMCRRQGYINATK